MAHQSDTDAAGHTRMIFTRPDGLSDLAARGPHTADATPNGPYVVVIDLSGGKAGFPADGRAGVTVITLGNHRSAYRIRSPARPARNTRQLPGLLPEFRTLPRPRRTCRSRSRTCHGHCKHGPWSRHGPRGDRRRWGTP